MDKKYVVGLGEALWDMLPDGKKLGGAPANFAYHARQLGMNAIAVSALGYDSLAEETIRQLEEKQLKYIMPRVPYPTGTVQVELDDNGIPAYDIRKGVAWDNIPFTDEMGKVAKSASAICWGSLAQRSATSRKTIYKFLDATLKDCLKIFDINLRQDFYTKEVIAESMKRCEALKINDEELLLIGNMFGYTPAGIEDTCRRIIKEYGIGILVLTRGAKDSYVFTPTQTSHIPTPKVEVADTVGAGDSFTGSFCAALLSGKPITEAHKIAVEVSAYVCTQKGPMPEVRKHFSI